MTATQPKVIIIDYKLSNLYSVENACRFTGINALISSEKEDIQQADALILPGVGAFSDAMDNLHKLDLVNPIRDAVAAGKPFLGICLGLQLLFTESEEFGNHKGLNFIEGTVKKFPDYLNSKKMKIPQIGWNTIYRKDTTQTWEKTALENINNEEFMYFVHSFYVQPVQNQDIICYTNYSGHEFCSAVKKNNIFATQFHPEKSSKEGIKIYENWKTINKL